MFRVEKLVDHLMSFIEEMPRLIEAALQQRVRRHEIRIPARHAVQKEPASDAAIAPLQSSLNIATKTMLTQRVIAAFRLHEALPLRTSAKTIPSIGVSSCSVCSFFFVVLIRV